MKREIFLGIIFFTGIFILPFVFWPRTNVAYEVPRVIFFQRWVEILAIIFLAFNLKNLKRLNFDTTLITFLVGFYATAFLSGLFGVDFGKSFWGNYFRNDGLLTLSHLIGLSILVGLFVRNTWASKISPVLSISSIIISFWSIANWRTNVGVSFGNPNFLAGFLLITLPFTTAMAPLATIPQIIAIFLTRALSPILGVAIFALLFFSIHKKINGKKSLSLTLLAISAIVAILSVIIFKELNQAKISDQYIAENRTRILVKAFLAASKRPILGWGWANFDYAFDSVDWPIKFENDVWVDKAHSNILEVLVTTGLVGLVFYLAILVRTFWNLFKKWGIANPFFSNFHLVRIPFSNQYCLNL